MWKQLKLDFDSEIGFVSCRSAWIAETISPPHIPSCTYDSGTPPGGPHAPRQEIQPYHLTPCPIPSARLDQCHQFSPITLKPAPFNAQTSIT